MIYLSVCSGIEAASSAWHHLGWRPAAFSEIEPFPSAVLVQRWPGVPNLGDFTKIKADDVGPIDLLVGGTPCQSFSIAGLRGGLGDDRGNLALEFLRLAQRTRPRWMVWENVPGVLSSVSHAAPDPSPPPPPVDLECDGAELETEDEYDSEELHAFNCFLAGLSDIGYGFAYAVLDAQYWGLAQRRERVFVVGYLGDWRPAAAVLFERESLSGHPAPRREKRKEVAGTLGSRSTAGGGLGTDFELDGGLVQAGCLNGHGEYGSDIPTLRAMNFNESHANAGGQVAVAYRTTGNDGCYELGQTAGCLNTATDPNAQVLVEAVSLRGREGGATAELGGSVSPSLRTGGGGGDKPHVLIGGHGYNGKTLQADTSSLLRRVRDQIGEEAFSRWGLGILVSLQHPEVLRSALHGCELRPAPFSRSWLVHCALSREEDRSEGALQSLREAEREGCSPSGRQPPEQLCRELGAYLSELSQPGAQAERFLHDLWRASEGLWVLQHALSEIQKARRPFGCEGQPVHGSSPGFGGEPEKGMRRAGMREEIPRERILQSACDASETWKSSGSIGQCLAVRRLTVEECEFLQGFPRGYTRIPWRGKPADQCPDGPRYRSLGNSMAVPVMSWIAERIELVEKTLRKTQGGEGFSLPEMSGLC